MYRLDLEINGLPPTTNSNTGHWRTIRKRNQKWKNLVILAVLNSRQKPILPLQKAKLTLTRHSSKEPDFDGLVSSFKRVIDGLTLSGVIIDDKMSVIGIPTYLWLYAPKSKGRISILVEGLT